MSQWVQSTQHPSWEILSLEPGEWPDVPHFEPCTCWAQGCIIRYFPLGAEVLSWLTPAPGSVVEELRANA